MYLRVVMICLRIYPKTCLKTYSRYILDIYTHAWNRTARIFVHRENINNYGELLFFSIYKSVTVSKYSEH